MLNFPMQQAYDQSAGKDEDAYFQILRQMAQMPDAQLPEPAMPQFDLKGMLIGSMLSGLVGGGEGANQFLQGTLAGKSYNQQQENVRREQEFRKKKLAQDREYGILKTEAEIANAKANRAFQRADNLRRDTQAERGRIAMEGRQRQTQTAMDLRGAEEDLGNAKTVDQYDRALGRFTRAGGKMDPNDVLKQRKGIMDREKLEHRLTAGRATLQSDHKLMSSPTADAQTKIAAAKRVFDVARNDPESARYILGYEPGQIESAAQQALRDAGVQSTYEKSRIANASAALARGESVKASAELAKVRTEGLKIALKYADEKERKALTEKNLRIEKLQREAREADNVLSGLMNKPMTGSTYESARRAYLTKIQEAKSNAALGETTLAMLKNKLKAKSFGTGEDAASVQHQIFLLEGTNELPGAIAIHTANAEQFQKEMDALTSRFSQSAQPAPQAAGPQKGATRTYQGFTYTFDGKEWVKQK